MTTLTAGASASITLTAGNQISGTGAGTAVIGRAGTVQVLTAGDAWRIGPYLTAQTVSITATSAMVYEQVAQVSADPSPADLGLSAAQVAATAALVSGAGNTARPNAAITKYGVRAYDTCLTTTPVGVTTLTHSLSNERPRFQNYTRKCVLTSAAAEIRFGSSSFTADQTEKALSIDIYIEQMPSELLSSVGGLNPFITFSISNTTSLGSNYSRWAFDTGYLRQGWNTLKIRQADTVSSTAGAGNLPIGCSHPADVGTGLIGPERGNSSA